METDFHAWAMLSTCYQALGEQREAARSGEEDGVRSPSARFSRTRATAPRSAFWPAAMRCSGEEEKTREWIDRALLIDPDNLNMRYNFACVLAGHAATRKRR